MRTTGSWTRYFTPTSTQRHLGLYCLGVGLHRGQTAPLARRVLGSYAVVRVTGGQGRLDLGPAHRRPLQAPLLFWLFPGVPHAYAPTPAGWDEQWVLFDGLAARGYEQLGYLDRADPVQPIASDDPVSTCFDALLQVAGSAGRLTGTEVAAGLHQLIVAAGRQRAGGPYRSDAHPLVTRLRDQACTSASVTEHARSLGVTVAALREAVRAAGAGSPNELILGTRLTRAKDLLVQTDLSVHQVAREVGYDDAAYFTRIFTARVGLAPTSFRAEQRRGDSSPTG